MPLEKVLIVNDDAEDILAMQARLPSDIEVFGASQFQAHYLDGNIGYDLIILDNDANDRQESKGQETLPEIRKRNPSVPVIYTSFQPGWVDASVYQTKGVDVVQTDQALDEVASRFGIELQEAEIVERTEPQLNIILSYNDVDGYNEGIYSDGKLLIVSFDKWAHERAQEVLREKVDKIYQDFEWRRDRDLVRNIFVYDGINGGEWPGRVASALGHDIRMPVNLMACRCEWERKQRLADARNINLYRVECGGQETLGAISDVILGIQRPGVEYDCLPISPERIKEGTPKYEV